MRLFYRYLMVCSLLMTAVLAHGVTYVVGGKGYTLERSQPASAQTEADKGLWVITEFLKGPSAEEKAAGIQSAVPSDIQIIKSAVKGDVLTVYVKMPADYLSSLNVIQTDEFYDSLGKSLFGIVTSYQVSVLVWDSATGTYKKLTDFLPPLPTVEPKGTQNEIIPEPVAPGKETYGQSITDVAQAESIAYYGQGQPTGQLGGKSIFISPGHGWYYASGSGTSSVWNTQRGNNYDIVEDLSNAEHVNYYLLQYLWNAGANTYSCRARSHTDDRYQVDNTDSGYSDNGGWTDSVSTSPYIGTNYRVIPAATVSTATATWRPTITKSDYYPVYVFYTGGTNRATAVTYYVVHSGGTTQFTLNQQRDGYTWKYIGTYHFNAGTQGCVYVTNQTPSPTGMYVIVDAICVGDGKGTETRGGVTSGQYKMYEASPYWAQYMKAPSTIYDNSTDPDNTDDIGCRPLYCNWEKESWEDPVFISWHSNAAGGGATGTEAYIWSDTWAFGQTATSDGVAPTGSYNLMNYVYTNVINDIRNGYDSSWTSRGKFRNNYGELRPITDYPALIIEMAFHDNGTKDALYMQDPKFRQILARSVYKGIVQYYANKGGFTAVYLPEPPTKLRVVNTGTGSVTLSWAAGASGGIYGGAPTGYRIYKGTNGYGFDNGIAVTGTSYTMSGLSVDSVYYFRMTATNTGGESFPTATLAVKIRNNGTANILIVNGFDREDRSIVPNITSTSSYDGSSNGTPKNPIPDKTNAFNYVVQHAKAIASASSGEGLKYYFDSADRTAVEDGSITLSNYTVVIWAAGKQAKVTSNSQTSKEALTANERSRITTFLSGAGKGLVISGAEVAYCLHSQGNGTFLNGTLHANIEADDAGSYTVVGKSGSVFDGISFNIDNGSGSTYDVPYPDLISPNSSTQVMDYDIGGTQLETFDSLNSWKDPNYSGSSNADAASTIGIVSSPLHQGSGAADLYYVWGTGNFIREYQSNSAYKIPVAATISMWVYGDNSNNSLRLCVRDTTDSELFVSPYTVVNFSGWQKLTWSDMTGWSRWSGSASSTIGDPAPWLDSIQISKTGTNASGHIYFDDITYSTGAASLTGAATLYNGSYKLLFLGFPFETITSESSRNSVMQSVLRLMIPESAVPVELSGFDTE